MTLHRFHRFCFYLTLVLLPTQLGIHLWPQWSLVLGRRIDYLSPTLYLTDILVLLTLGGWLIDIGFRKANYELGNMNYGKKYIPLIQYSLFSILILTNIFFSLSPAVAIYHWLKFLEFVLFGLYVVKTKPPIFMIHQSLFIAVLYSSVIAIVQFYLQHSIGGPLWLLGERTFSQQAAGIAQYSWCSFPVPSGCQLFLRSYGTFPHPNVLGGFLAVILPLLIFPAPQAGRNFQFLIFKKFTVVVGILALILTFSRSAWIVFLLGFVWHKKRNIAISVVLLVCAWYISGTFHSFDESVIVRQQLNHSAIAIGKTHPWFGVGLGNFIIALPSFLPEKFIYFLQPVHNIYLLLLSEVGIVGICVLLLMVYIFLKNELRVMNHGKVQKTIIHTSLFMILLLGLVDHYPLTLQQGQLLLTLLMSLWVAHTFVIHKS